MMEKRIEITRNDYHRLMSIIELSSLKGKLPANIEKIYEALKRSRMLPQEKISKGVITMNSRVLIKELTTGRTTEISITYPDEAEPVNRKVSVFSPIGLQLLGRNEREVVSWKVPGGEGLFEILEITYQPEAAGDFHL